MICTSIGRKSTGLPDAPEAPDVPDAPLAGGRGAALPDDPDAPDGPSAGFARTNRLLILNLELSPVMFAVKVPERELSLMKLLTASPSAIVACFEMGSGKIKGMLQIFSRVPFGRLSLICLLA